MTNSVQSAGAAVSSAAPAFAFAIEEGKAHEFARATGANGLVRDGSGWLAPPTFLTVSQLWMAPEHAAWFGISRNYGRVLHGEQRFEYPRGLPRVGDRFHARQGFGRSFEKLGSQGNMHFQEVVTRFWKEHEEDPDAIMTSLSITLPPVEESAPAMTDKSQPEVTQPRQSDDSPETRSDAAGGRPIAATQSALDVFTSSPLTITDFVRYQGASGDFNPIHHDVDFARRGGYDGPFAVGMLTAGVAAARFNELRDPRDLRGLRMRWQAPAWPGDELTYVLTAATDGLQCAVTRFNPETAARREAHMTAWATYA